MIHGMLAAGGWQDRRAANLLDGGAPFYGTYETADGKYMAVGALEQQFYAEFAELLELGEVAGARGDLGRWDELRAAVAARFKERTRDEWVAVFEGSDACVAPVLSSARPRTTRTSPPAAPSSTMADSPSRRPRPASPTPPQASTRAPPCPAPTPPTSPATGTYRP